MDNLVGLTHHSSVTKRPWSSSLFSASLLSIAAAICSRTESPIAVDPQTKMYAPSLIKAFRCALFSSSLCCTYTFFSCSREKAVISSLSAGGLNCIASSSSSLYMKSWSARQQPKYNDVLDLTPPSALNSRTKARKGASPVPAPIMTTGVALLRGSRNRDALTAIHSLSPTAVRVHNIVEQAPQNFLGSSSLQASCFSADSTSPTSQPCFANLSTMCFIVSSLSLTILTQIPIRDESSRDEEEIVYGLLLCLGQSWRKVLRSISAEEKKNANSSMKLKRMLGPVSHWYASRSSTRAVTAALSCSSLTKAANWRSTLLGGAVARSQKSVNALRIVQGTGKGLRTALSTPLALTNATLLSRSSSTPSLFANHSTSRSGFSANTSRLSAVFQFSAGKPRMSTSMCFVVRPSSTFGCCRNSFATSTGACDAAKYHFPKTSAPPTCTKGSTGG
mmetsp:Transcript_24403/g.56239  ORF Transcript_24403/g.56239 Transcript_24403/m.56239 type:complete len:448 (-) Transcript_24403:835-2178(-)